MSRRIYVLGFSLVGVLIVGAAGTWYYHTSRPEYRLRRAQDALRSGAYDEAEVGAASLEASGHRDEAVLVRVEAILLRAEAENRTEGLAAALALLNKLPSDSPVALEVAALAGRCLLRLGNLADAERTFAYVLAQDPENVDAHRGLMAVYYDLGALLVAVQHAEAWAERSPRDGRPYRFVALVRRDLGHFQEAIAPYRMALERELTDRVRAEVSIELAECLTRTSQYAAAQQVLDATRPPAELLPRVLTAQAGCERRLNRPDTARELVARALALQPHYTEALRVSAELALDVDDPGRAAQELERAAALEPAEFDTFHLLSRAYSRLGNKQMALAAQRRVKEIQHNLDEMTELTRELLKRPKDAELHRKIAVVCTRLNMAASAATQRRVAAALDQALSQAPTAPAP